ncbi:MAG TPA: copper ion binding protein, partial [bacterium]
MATKRLDLPVEGMSCASCVATVEHGLKASPGVDAVAVNLAAGRASITYHPESTTTARFVDVVRSLGYDVPVQKVQIPVRGMSCASCVEKVEGALRAVNGVLDASVNLASERATVTALVTTPVAELRRAIRDAGYEPLEVAGAQVEDYERHARQRELGTLRRKLIVGALLTIPVLWGSLQHMGVQIWTPEFLMNWYVQLALATPVQFWAGWQFYRGAWAMARHRT